MTNPFIRTLAPVNSIPAINADPKTYNLRRSGDSDSSIKTRRSPRCHVRLYGHIAMSLYTYFAVIGAGALGTRIVSALLARGAYVLVLSRPSSPGARNPLPCHHNLHIAKVEYDDLTGVSDILRSHSIQVVVSTLNASAAAVQIGLADAAKAAGVKLFSPSDYGPIPTIGMPPTDSYPGILEKVAKHLELNHVDTVRFFTGLFIGYIGWITGLSSNGRINIVGKGLTPMSLTAEDDVAGFVAHVLTTLPPSQLHNHVFRIEGDRTTMAALSSMFHTTLAHLDEDGLIEGGSRKTLLTYVENGAMSTGWDYITGRDHAEVAGVSNHLWEGHRWKNVKDVHSL